MRLPLDGIKFGPLNGIGASTIMVMVRSTSKIPTLPLKTLNVARRKVDHSPRENRRTDKGCPWRTTKIYFHIPARARANDSAASDASPMMIEVSLK